MVPAFFVHQDARLPAPLDEGFALVETVAPASVRDRSLGELGVRKRYGITV